MRFMSKPNGYQIPAMEDHRKCMEMLKFQRHDEQISLPTDAKVSAGKAFRWQGCTFLTVNVETCCKDHKRWGQVH